jgi:hypothetical protein
LTVALVVIRLFAGLIQHYFAMKHRERVKFVRNWRNAGIDESKERGRATLVRVELFLVLFVVAHYLFQLALKSLFSSASFSTVVFTSLIAAAFVASIGGNFLLNQSLKSQIIKFLVCTLPSSFWGFLAADTIDKSFRGNRVDQLIGGAIIFLISLKIHSGAFDHLDD